MRYDPAAFDCADLFVLAQRELFGRDVRIPFHPRTSARLQGNAIAAQLDDLSAPVAMPVHGCAVLMTSPLASGARQWHIGTVLMDAAGRPWVLHAHSEELGILIHPLDEVAGYGLRVEMFREVQA